MKILSGTLKGRKIIVPQGCRPVSERVRKSCFDILRGEIAGKKVLDLFAGSGSLGLEALSQGADLCWFVDCQKKALSVVKNNLLALEIKQKAKTYLKDSFLALKDLSGRKVRFDIVFLDPPYYKAMLTKALQALEDYDILAASGYLVTFAYYKDILDLKSHKFSLIINKSYGQTVISIYTKNK